MPIIFLFFHYFAKISALDSNFNLKKGNVVEQDIAGPCCFSSDIIAHQRKLPLLEQNDFIILHDTGAYYYSSFNYYNSRKPPNIYGFEQEEPSKLFLLKKAPNLDALITFWE